LAAPVKSCGTEATHSFQHCRQAAISYQDDSRLLRFRACLSHFSHVPATQEDS